MGERIRGKDDPFEIMNKNLLLRKQKESELPEGERLLAQCRRIFDLDKERFFTVTEIKQTLGISSEQTHEILTKLVTENYIEIKEQVRRGRKYTIYRKKQGASKPT